jgi:hypothetical protein
MKKKNFTSCFPVKGYSTMKDLLKEKNIVSWTVLGFCSISPCVNIKSKSYKLGLWKNYKIKFTIFLVKAAQPITQKFLFL